MRPRAACLWDGNWVQAAAKLFDTSPEKIQVFARHNDLHLIHLKPSKTYDSHIFTLCSILKVSSNFLRGCLWINVMNSETIPRARHANFLRHLEVSLILLERGYRGVPAMPSRPARESKRETDEMSEKCHAHRKKWAVSDNFLWPSTRLIDLIGWGFGMIPNVNQFKNQGLLTTAQQLEYSLHLYFHDFSFWRLNSPDGCNPGFMAKKHIHSTS